MVDTTIVNKRRRGIAVDQNGAIVAQSDLTFATNTSIIIEEVKVKLVSSGLVKSQFSSFGGSDLAVISTSLTYLEDNTALDSNFNFDTLLQDSGESPDSEDESVGLGLNAFINNLKGGKKLRIRSRAAMKSSATAFQTQIAQTKTDGANAITAPSVVAGVGKETGNQNTTSGGVGFKQ